MGRARVREREVIFESSVCNESVEVFSRLEGGRRLRSDGVVRLRAGN